MRIQMEVNGRSREATVERAGQAYKVTLDGQAHLIDVARIDATTYSLVMLDRHGACHEVGLAETAARDELLVHLRTGVIPVRIDRGGRFGRKSADAHGTTDGARPVTAPMPGKVLRVLVGVGDTVTARQGLVVVEAMKMENELRAPKAGRIVEVHVREGMSVEAGRVLLVVE